MDTASGHDTRLKELLYRSEADRIHLQQDLRALSDDRSKTEAEKQALHSQLQHLTQQLEQQQQLYKQSQHQVAGLQQNVETLQQDLVKVRQQYRANDIIAINLRDQIYKLRQQLKDAKEHIEVQDSKYATVHADFEALTHAKIEVDQQLAELQAAHQTLNAEHQDQGQQLDLVRRELALANERWENQFGDLERSLASAQSARVQLEAECRQLQQEAMRQQDVAAAANIRAQEMEAEITCIRETVMVVGKAVERQGAGPLPSHNDPVWQVPGPLGGVQHTLDVIGKHVRSQDSKLKANADEVERLMDRVRSETAQKVELQESLFEARALYASVVSDREALEARTARAEAEKAASEQHYARAKEQIQEDHTRIRELQENLLALTKQLQTLLPLQPRVAAAESERDALHHRLTKLQEHFDLTHRQLEQVVGREAETRSSLEGYKQEHAQLLSSNAALMELNQTLSKRMQGLELQVREAANLQEQLAATKKKLESSTANMTALTESHMATLKKLDTAKRILEGMGEGGLLSPRAGASRPTSASVASGATSSSNSAASSRVASARPRSPLGPRPGADGEPLDPVAEGSVSGEVSLARMRQGSEALSEEGDRPGTPGLAPEVLEMLQRAGLGNDLLRKQRAWHSLKVAMLTQHQQQLKEEVVHLQCLNEQLQLELLHQQTIILEQQTIREQQVAAAVVELGQEAVSVLEPLLRELQELMLEDAEEMQEAEDGHLEGDAEGDHSAGGASVTDGSSSKRRRRTSVGAMMDMATKALARASNGGFGHGSHGGHSSSSQPTSAGAGAAGAPQPPSSSYAQSVMASMQALREAKPVVRFDKAVQSDEAIQDDWVGFVRSLRGQTTSHGLTHQAVAEVIVRLYCKGAVEWQNKALAYAGSGVNGGSPTNSRSTTPWAMPPGSSPNSSRNPLALAAAAGAANAGPGHASTGTSTAISSSSSSSSRSMGVAALTTTSGSGGTVFDLLTVHYSHAGKPGAVSNVAAGAAAVAGGGAYAAHLWKDPSGPVARLLLSCQQFAAADLKVALFCRWCGLCEPAHALGPEPWQLLLLVVAALQKLLGASWKSTLRAWATPAGARVPVQCAIDLLGNVYNFQSPAELSLNLLTTTPLSAASRPTPQSRRGVGSKAGPEAAAGGGPGGPPLGCPAWPPSATGGLKAALQQLLVAGPAGPAVDLDQLLAFLVMEYCAGRLPEHGLLVPRHLSDGVLLNATNAWGPGTAAPATAASLVPGTAPEGGEGVPVTGATLHSTLSAAWDSDGSRPASGLFPPLKSAEQSSRAAAAGSEQAPHTVKRRHSFKQTVTILGPAGPAAAGGSASGGGAAPSSPASSAAAADAGGGNGDAFSSTSAAAATAAPQSPPPSAFAAAAAGGGGGGGGSALGTAAAGSRDSGVVGGIMPGPLHGKRLQPSSGLR